MKKLLMVVLACLLMVVATGCEEVEEPDALEPVIRIVPGSYYTAGHVITDDGNIWDFSQDIISEAPSYDNEPVYALIDDAGTPDHIYDDEIIGLVGR